MHSVHNIYVFFFVYYILPCKDHIKDVCKYIGTNNVTFVTSLVV